MIFLNYRTLNSWRKKKLKWHWAPFGNNYLDLAFNVWGTYADISFVHDRAKNNTMVNLLSDCVSMFNMTNVNYIIDIQGYKSVSNDFIVKGLVIVSVDERVYKLILFNLHYDLRNFTHLLQKQVIWLEKQFHGLLWNSGIKPYSDFKKVFSGVGIDESNIFVGGGEKQKCIYNFIYDFNVTVLNFDDFNCPNLNTLIYQFWN